MGYGFSRFSVRDPFHCYHVRSEVKSWTWLHSTSRFCREVNDRTSSSFLHRKQCRKHSDRRLSMSARLVFRPLPPNEIFISFFLVHLVVQSKCLAWLSVIHQEMQWFTVLCNWVISYGWLPLNSNCLLLQRVQFLVAPAFSQAAHFPERGRVWLVTLQPSSCHQGMQLSNSTVRCWHLLNM